MSKTKQTKPTATKKQRGTRDPRRGRPMNPSSGVSKSKLSLFVKLCVFALLLGAAVYYYTHVYIVRSVSAERFLGIERAFKKLGHGIVDVAEDVGEDAVDLAEDVGEDAVDLAKDVGHGAVDLAKDVGHGAVDAAYDVGDVAEDTVDVGVDGLAYGVGTVSGDNVNKQYRNNFRKGFGIGFKQGFNGSMDVVGVAKKVPVAGKMLTFMPTFKV